MAGLRGRPQRIGVAPGSRHWEVFTDLCRAIGATGKDIPDAYLAAMAIESDCTLVTADRTFSRFLRLRVRRAVA